MSTLSNLRRLWSDVNRGGTPPSRATMKRTARRDRAQAEARRYHAEQRELRPMIRALEETGVAQ